MELFICIIACENTLYFHSISLVSTLQFVNIADVAPVVQRIPRKQKKLNLVQTMWTRVYSLVYWVPAFADPQAKYQASRVVQATSFLALRVSMACSDVLQATPFFWAPHEQGLAAPVVSPVQIKGMIFALIGSSLQACVNIIFSYLTALHDSNAELTGFWKFLVKHCHTWLAWPIISGQQHLDWYRAVKRHEGLKIMSLVLRRGGSSSFPVRAMLSSSCPKFWRAPSGRICESLS